VDDRDRQREQVLDHAIVVRADGGDGIRRFAVRRGVANGGQITIKGLAENILALTGSASPVIHRSDRKAAGNGLHAGREFRRSARGDGELVPVPMNGCERV
jgi:hypothetical protein